MMQAVSQVIGLFSSFILCRDAKIPVVSTVTKVDINVIITVVSWSSFVGILQGSSKSPSNW
jgi:hypothetical protein